MFGVVQGKTVLVTGGSRGIGFGLVAGFAAHNRVIFCGSSPNSVEGALVKFKELLSPDQWANIRGVPCDIANEGQVAELFTGIAASHPSLDVVVNNAGITRDNLILRMKTEEWDAVMATNLKGAFLVSRAAAKLMVKQRSGVLINISSVIGQSGNAGQANYAASKAGIIGMTLSLAKELGGRGIRVNAIAPGFIATEMTQNLNDSAREKLRERITLGRLGEVADVVGVAQFLASPAASYITGQVITVDGGLAL